MKYNFDEIIERRGTNSYKWDLVKEDGVIPMWVADIDVYKRQVLETSALPTELNP